MSKSRKLHQDRPQETYFEKFELRFGVLGGLECMQLLGVVDAKDGLRLRSPAALTFGGDEFRDLNADYLERI